MTEKRFELPASPAIAALSMVEFAARAPEADEVVVKVEASSLNFHDYLVVTGIIPTQPGRVPLSDGVGVVTACGDRVTRFAVGDRVMGTFFADWIGGEPTGTRTARMGGDHVDGFAATCVTISEQRFTKVPAGLSAVEAATLPCAGLTAWRAIVVEGRVGPGDTVVVQGSGGVSLFAMQFARMAGARVIATTGSSAKAARLKELGASEVVDRNDPKWGRAVRDLTASGATHLVEVAGGDLSQSLQALGVGGRLCLVGALSRQPIQFPTIHMIHANRHIDGITVGSRDHQEAMVAAIELHGLSPVVDSVYPLDQLGAAFAYFETQQHFGKIAINAERD